MRRIHALFAVVVLLAALVPATAILAAPATVGGTITTTSKIALGPGAVAVVTIVDQQASPSAPDRPCSTWS